MLHPFLRAGFYTNASSSDTTAKIMWTPQTAGADAAAVTGYFVSATHLGPADADYLKVSAPSSSCMSHVCHPARPRNIRMKVCGSVG